MKRSVLSLACVAACLPACLEGMLLALADPDLPMGVVLQSLSAWWGFGFVIFLILARYTISSYWRISLYLTVLLNLPWYLALSILPGKWDHLIPLVIASGVLGVLSGWFSRYLIQNHLRESSTSH